jgi:hypothetical protein
VDCEPRASDDAAPDIGADETSLTSDPTLAVDTPSQFAQAAQQMSREFAHYSAQAVARATTNPWLAGLGVILLILAGGLAFALMRVLHVRQ